MEIIYFANKTYVIIPLLRILRKEITHFQEKQLQKIEENFNKMYFINMDTRWINR